MIDKINKLLNGRLVDGYIKACLYLLLVGIGMFVCLIFAFAVWNLL